MAKQLTIDWTSYGNAIAEGIRRERDGNLPTNPAVQALLSGDSVTFEFGPDTNVVPDADVVWEARNFYAGDYEPSEPIESLTDEEIDEIGKWYGTNPREGGHYDITDQIVEAIESSDED